MSFENDYPKRKDWRKPYRKAKAFVRSCRNHGSCPYCLNNRMYNTLKRKTGAYFDYSSTIYL
mgnify:FL=1